MPTRRKLKDDTGRPNYRNLAENQFVQAARAQGWIVSKRGYPDFICRRGDNVMLVEVKKTKGQRLKRSQDFIMNYLAAHGVKCYKWTPDTNWLEETI